MSFEDQFRSTLKSAKELEANKLDEALSSKNSQAQFFRENHPKFDALSNFAKTKGCLIFGPYNWPSNIDPFHLDGRTEKPDQKAFIRICVPLRYRSSALSRLLFGERTGEVQTFRELKISYFGDKLKPMFACHQNHYELNVGKGEYYKFRLWDDESLRAVNNEVVSDSIKEIESFVIRRIADVEGVFRKRY